MALPESASNAKTVLVCVIKDKRDLDILLHKHWYRIPLAHLPVRLFTHLAFYQPAAFGREGKRIRYYARVLGRCVRERFALLPDEINHRNAQKPYKRLRIGTLRALPHPVRNTSPRRVSFGFTSLRRLRRSKNILELYGVPDTEKVLARRMRRMGIGLLPQHCVSYGNRHRLDFALFCKHGKVAIECDNTKAHAGQRKRTNDGLKDARLRRNGWMVMRFTDKDIIEKPNACAQKIVQAARKLGGQRTMQMPRR